MLSPVAILRQIAPKAAPALVDAFARTADLNAAGLVTPLRLAQFMTHVAHETQGFTRLRESGKYSAKRISEVFGVGRHSAAVTPAEASRLAGDERALFERVYGLGNPRKAKELGNLYAGDGYAYRGGGAMHSTGRDAYTRLGLADDPDAIETAEHCLRGALDHWTLTGCNALADVNDLRATTKKVNGGYNGYDDRVAWFNKIWPLLRDEESAPESWKAARPSEATRLLQGQLRDLGYDIKADGLYGPATTDAVVAFQRANGLAADGIAGELTTSAIAARLAGTAPATSTVTVTDPPPVAPPVAAGVSTIALAEAGKQITQQADAVAAFAGFSDVAGYFAAGLTAIGVTIIVIGIVRSYVIPAIWPAKAPVPA